MNLEISLSCSAKVWIQLFLVAFFWFLLLVLLPLPMVIGVQTALVLTGLGLFKATTGPKALQNASMRRLDGCIGCCSGGDTEAEAETEDDEWGMLLWMSSKYPKSPSNFCESFLISCSDLFWGFRKNNERIENIEVVVYAILLTSILSPTLIIALWLGIETLACDTSFGETCAILYSFVFASAMRDLEFPDILAVLQEFPPDFSAMIKWIANIDLYLEFDPAGIMRNARLLTAIQTWLAITKAIMTLGNFALTVLRLSGHNFKTIPIHEILYGEVPKSRIRSDPSIFQHLSPKQRNMTELAEIAFEKDLKTLQHAGSHALKELIGKFTLPLVVRMVNKQPDILKHILHSYIVSEKAKGKEPLGDCPKDIVKCFIEVDACALEHSGPASRNDYELVKMAFKQDKHSLKFAGKGAVERLIRDDDANALQYVPQLQNDEQLVLAAYQRDKTSLKYAGESAVKHILQDHDKEALSFASREIRTRLAPRPDTDQ